MEKILITGGSGFIGTNMIEFLEEKGFHSIINYDKSKPVKPNQEKYWVEGNIMNESYFEKVLEKHQVDTVIHLAARTDTLSEVLEDYKENHKGTQHVLNAIKKYGKIERLIVTSTQYVYKSSESFIPVDNKDFKPYTVYGESKVLTEQYTHSADLKCIWTIIRPTNIWGPWHMRYPIELWRIIDKGMYFHPVSQPVLRTYGYVKNIVHQIYQMLIADEKLVNKKTFYVGDLTIDSYLWINELSLQLNGNRVRRLPTFIFSLTAKFGDILRKLRIPFPLYSKRFQNMIEDYPAPTAPTVELFGQAENNLQKNVLETVNWLKDEGKNYFEYWNKNK